MVSSLPQSWRKEEENCADPRPPLNRRPKLVRLQLALQVAEARYERLHNAAAARRTTFVYPWWRQAAPVVIVGLFSSAGLAVEGPLNGGGGEAVETRVDDKR